MVNSSTFVPFNVSFADFPKGDLYTLTSGQLELGIGQNFLREFGL